MTSPSKPKVTLSCKRRVDPQTGLVGIALNFSYEYNPLIQQAISMYDVDVLVTNPDGSNGVRIGSYMYDPAFVSEVGIGIFILKLSVCIRNISSSVCYARCRVF